MVVLVRLKAPLDRLRSDDLILALIHIFGRFYSEVARDASECLIGGAWSWGAIEDDIVQRSLITRSTLPI